MRVVKIQRIISGGQTGIDQLGLEVAKSLSIPTGGVAPKGFLTEDGPNTQLRDVYGLADHISADYPPRTKSNVQQSDGTVVFGELTGGTKLTVDACQKAGKPHIINPTADALRVWLIEHQIKVLNVAGNRGSSLQVEQLQQYRKILYDVLTTNQRLAVLFRKEPAQWGLRGDPYLWAELRQAGETLMLPESTDALKELLRLLIHNLTGLELKPGQEQQVSRYKFGGMSSGVVSANFWLEEAIPLLRHRLTLLREGDL
ncbi:YpsA SLOG family protein [Spirosoma sordidisoli]|uniref:Molybdenum cofactor carrier n=1 Tax=Spirosoma sordidisoli TaxID=2502893 RepID=A0A4Q2UMQ1_9BACT|nr:putative molybdenum carrier protein [Spirosoma sordidisoli]RYC70062.1 hypothetical protein EQG79_09330 [Spirosoma sordidisoli]